MGAGPVTPAELAILTEGMTEQQKMMFLSQYNTEKKDRYIALILPILFGCFGVEVNGSDSKRSMEDYN